MYFKNFIVMKKVRFIPNFLFLLLLFGGCSNSKSEIISLSGFTMGTTYNIKIFEQKSIENIQQLQSQIDSVLLHVNKLFSTYMPDSEISQFNKSDSLFTVSDEFNKLFLLSKIIYKNSNGAFDPTVHPLVKLWGFGNKGKINELPSNELVLNTFNKIGFDNIFIKNNLLIKSNQYLELDFSAIAKGYGVDKVSELLINNNVNNFMVEIGGEVYCHGNKLNDDWVIGLQNPFSELGYENILKVINLKNKAMATSGNYRNYFEIDGQKYSHTINPQTGFPVTHNIVSVSVIANDCSSADGYATALMVMEKEAGLKLINSISGLEAIIIYGEEENYKLLKSDGIDKIMNDL
jgi:FAD:protein FMN transferase